MYFAKGAVSNGKHDAVLKAAIIIDTENDSLV